jgi:hypothetical protein
MMAASDKEPAAAPNVEAQIGNIVADMAVSQYDLLTAYFWGSEDICEIHDVISTPPGDITDALFDRVTVTASLLVNAEFPNWSTGKGASGFVEIVANDGTINGPRARVILFTPTEAESREERTGFPSFPPDRKCIVAGQAVTLSGLKASSDLRSEIERIMRGYAMDRVDILYNQDDREKRFPKTTFTRNGAISEGFALVTPAPIAGEDPKFTMIYLESLIQAYADQILQTHTGQWTRTELPGTGMLTVQNENGFFRSFLEHNHRTVVTQLRRHDV